MSGGNSANNSWTVLTPVTVAETLRPLAEGTEHHEESLTSAAVAILTSCVCDEPDSGASQPAGGEASTEGSPVVERLVSEEKTDKLIGDTSTEQDTSVPPAITDAPVLTSLEVPGSSVSGDDALDHSGDLPEGPAMSSPDPDSFSDSYTHIFPSRDEPPASLLRTETLGGGEFRGEEIGLAQEETLRQLNGEELQPEEDESHLSPRATDLGKQADSRVDPEVGEERTGEEGEPEVRRRRSLLAALERIGRTEVEEEEEEREEVFQVPQREEYSGFSVNKCILGAVILLGLGTIFFSGVLMDLDEESDYGTRELKDSDVPGKQEWLNPEVPPPTVDADSTELLNKLAKGNQQISVLQAQLQTQKEEVTVSVGQAAEGAKERLRWGEVEKENSRLKTEMASLLVLQKENERMKRELESVPALQKELETLRSTVTELKRSSAASEAAQAPMKSTTLPPSGQPEDSSQDTTTARQAGKPWNDQKEKMTDWKKEKYDNGEKKEWKEREKAEWKEGQKKERKDGKHEQGKSDKVKDKEGKQKRHSDETKQWKGKEWKKEKVNRGEEGKPWKAREGKEEWVEKSEKKDRKEVKDGKKAKHDKVKEGKQEKMDWKRGKDVGEKHKGKEEWKGEKEWKKVKDGFKESGKEKWEMKDWKEKGEKKEWKKDGEWRGKNGKDAGKERKGKEERKQWDESENESKNHSKERKGKDERKQKEKEGKSKNDRDDKEWKEKDERKPWERKDEDWKKGQKENNEDRKQDRSQKHKDEYKMSGNHHDEHVWGDGKAPHTHHRPSLEQPEYWVQQRDRLRHNPNAQQDCNSLETCAQAEGLLPVPLPEFEAVLQTYLTKAEEAGVDASKREELKKLAAEFFKDGVFVHDQMSFQDFVEDVSDILEDMVEGDENGDEMDSDIEEEMEEFEREVMKKFSTPAAGEKEEGIRGERRKESGRGRG
ncbi:pre-B-cell leukemia homeobox interacting protein 1b isoform X3 [Scophthalmus maximus]|uniref:pre-B-cell leukemia homeobox interacting protein 1b isoform X3 n=1 Tax=Scophthalmus maximus TaxID=52904 RepID=UPI001FA90B22|nr:pre-B-cell leukemia homeobox interacting protein 1b isoform X3 [Scophthalmus maximus]